MRAIVLLLAVVVASGCGGAASPAGGSAPPTQQPEITIPPILIPATATPRPTPSPTAPPATIAPTAPPVVAFGIRFEPPSPRVAEPLLIIVVGMRPGEALELTVQPPSRPLTDTADAYGEFRLELPDGLRESSCVTARAGGRTARAPFGSATACAGADAPLTGPYPAIVGPTEYFSIRVDLPVGTPLTFLGLTGPDGRRHPDYGGTFGWQRVVTERPSSMVHRFSPEYERAGPLPAGVYVWSFEANGQRYDFRVTLAR